MTEITHEQANRANHLLNTVGGHSAIIELAKKLPPETLALIREAHSDPTADMCCVAHCEGLNCCIDILLDDPARYDPAKVTEAEDLMRRYREQLHR